MAGGYILRDLLLSIGSFVSGPIHGVFFKIPCDSLKLDINNLNGDYFYPFVHIVHTVLCILVRFKVSCMMCNACSKKNTFYELCIAFKMLQFKTEFLFEKHSQNYRKG